jgi:hypothetical protein
MRIEMDDPHNIGWGITKARDNSYLGELIHMVLEKIRAKIAAKRANMSRSLSDAKDKVKTVTHDVKDAVAGRNGSRSLYPGKKQVDAAKDKAVELKDKILAPAPAAAPQNKEAAAPEAVAAKQEAASQANVEVGRSFSNYKSGSSTYGTGRMV